VSIAVTAAAHWYRADVGSWESCSQRAPGRISAAAATDLQLRSCPINSFNFRVGRLAYAFGVLPPPIIITGSSWRRVEMRKNSAETATPPNATASNERTNDQRRLRLRLQPTVGRITGLTTVRLVRRSPGSCVLLFPGCRSPSLSSRGLGQTSSDTAATGTFKAVHVRGFFNCANVARYRVDDATITTETYNRPHTGDLQLWTYLPWHMRAGRLRRDCSRGLATNAR